MQPGLYMFSSQRQQLIASLALVASSMCLLLAGCPGFGDASDNSTTVADVAHDGLDDIGHVLVELRNADIQAETAVSRLCLPQPILPGKELEEFCGEIIAKQLVVRTKLNRVAVLHAAAAHLLEACERTGVCE